MLQKNLGNHGSSSGLAVSTAYRNGHFVVLHHLPQKLCTGQNGNGSLACGKQLRVIGFDGAGIYYQIDIGRDIFLSLAVIYGGAFLFQRVGQRRRSPVRAGYTEAF